MPDNPNQTNTVPHIEGNNGPNPEAAIDVLAQNYTRTGAQVGEARFQPGLPGSDALSIDSEEMEQARINLLMDVTVQVTVELGHTRMTLRQVLELQNGSVIELDRIAGDPVDIFVNDRLLARGEVVVVDDKFGVRITELVPPKKKSGDF